MFYIIRYCARVCSDNLKRVAKYIKMSLQVTIYVSCLTYLFEIKFHSILMLTLTLIYSELIVSPNEWVPSNYLKLTH